MNLKEHLQFLAMLIPTLLILIWALASLALPARSAPEAVPAQTMTQDADAVI